MVVKVIGSHEEFLTIIKSGKPAVIDFWADWCGPCRLISPVFEGLSGEESFAGVDFYKVDVDSQQQISQEAGIKAMPTFQLYHNGSKVNELVGADQGGLKTLLGAASGLV